MGDAEVTDAPDPKFVSFFADEWQELLDRVKIPGMPDASWDRKAAYLFWEETKPRTSTGRMHAMPFEQKTREAVTVTMTPKPVMPWEQK